MQRAVRTCRARFNSLLYGVQERHSGYTQQNQQTPNSMMNTVDTRYLEELLEGPLGQARRSVVFRVPHEVRDVCAC